MTAGLSLPHDAAPLHVTGQARYIDDLPTPANALHLAFGLSTTAHGTIIAIDISAVKAAAGVVAVSGRALGAVAKAGGAQFIDLTLLITKAYRQIGEETVNGFFADQRTHTNQQGAAFNAVQVVEGLKGLPGHPFARFFNQ